MCIVISYQLKLVKMRAKLANRNDCAAPFLSRATADLCWYICSIFDIIRYTKVDMVFNINYTKIKYYIRRKKVRPP